MTLNDAQPQGAAQAAPEGQPQTVPEASPQETLSDSPAQSDPQPGPAPAPFVMMGKSFASQADAENYFSQALRSAHGRARAAMEQAARLQPQPQQAPPQAQPPYDQSVYEELVRAYGPAAAEEYRRTETAKFERSQLQKEVDERLKPLEEARQRAEMEARTVELFARAKSVTDPQTGQPLFPEFGHPAASAAIVQIWEEIHPEVAVTPAGIRQAVDIYRGRVAAGMTRTPPQPSRPAPSGQSASPSNGSGAPSGTAPSHNAVQAIPRQWKTDLVTGERYL